MGASLDQDTICFYKIDRLGYFSCWIEIVIYDYWILLQFKAQVLWNFVLISEVKKAELPLIITLKSVDHAFCIVFLIS